MIPKRIVLDTNVCLDLFVFRDPRWAQLHLALTDGAVEAVTRYDCRMEWLLVLNYPHLPLNDDSRNRVVTEFDSLITCIAPDALCPEIRLPVCSDPDDQKFLELSRDAGADVLITKDKALLKLAKKTVKAGLFIIMPPDAWATYAQPPH
jgi:putative PIN family toxin of toxin-antitoxin system